MTFHIASSKEYKVGEIAEIRFGDDSVKCRVLEQKEGAGAEKGRRRSLVTAKYLYKMELVK